MNRYKINDIEFELKKRFTLKELNQINKIFSKIYDSNNQIVANISNDELGTFLKTVLIPVDKLPDNFDFMDADESVTAEVIKDFFLSRIELNRNILTS